MATRLYAVCVWMMLFWFVNPALGGTADETNLARGKILYEKYCQACHGTAGKGDGTMQFDPPPADLTSSEVVMKSNVQLLKSIHEGRPNTAMDAWKSVMSERAMHDVLAYVRTLAR